MREKLARDKDKAYLSLDLGTIRTNAPVDTDINSYIPGDNSGAAMLLAKYELYSLIDKFGLNAQQAVEPVRQEEKTAVTVKEMEDPADFSFGEELYFTFDIENNEISRMYFANGDTVITVSASDADFEDFIKRLFESDARKYSYNTKYLHRLAATLGTDCKTSAAILCFPHICCDRQTAIMILTTFALNTALLCLTAAKQAKMPFMRQC